MPPEEAKEAEKTMFIKPYTRQVREVFEGSGAQKDLPPVFWRYEYLDRGINIFFVALEFSIVLLREHDTVLL